MQRRDRAPLTAISLFSGAGGDTLGLENAGVNVVGFVEWEAPMIATHLANFPNSVLIGKDVREVTEEQLDPYKNRVDIIFAGFPCQGLSKAGKKDPGDSRNNLFREFVRITSIVRPRFIIGENVKHILKMKTPEDEDVCEVIVRAFQEIGYGMATPQVLRACDFGVPQKRERCFFVGFRSDQSSSSSSFSWNRVAEIGSTFPDTRLRDIIERNSLDLGMEITVEQAAAFGLNDERLLELDLELGSSDPDAQLAPLNLRKCVEAGELSFGKRASPTHSEIVDPDGYAKTLICTYNRMPRMFVALCDPATQNIYLRPFTINEAKQIQGFPKEYIITGNRMTAIKQIGNSVPPPIITAIVRALI